MSEKIVTRQDDNYGEIKYEFAAHIDYSEMVKRISFDNYQAWAKKYHPTKFFHAALFLNSKGVGHEVAFDLYVCVDDANSDWDSSYWMDKYQMTGCKKKKLPVAISRKKLQEWKDSFYALVSGDFKG